MVMVVEYWPGANDPSAGCTTNCAGCDGENEKFAGNRVTAKGDFAATLAVAEAVSGLAVLTRTVCDPGEDVPACRTNIRLVGCTTADNGLPFGNTLRSTVTTWGVFVAPDART